MYRYVHTAYVLVIDILPLIVYNRDIITSYLDILTAVLLIFNTIFLMVYKVMNTLTLVRGLLV